VLGRGSIALWRTIVQQTRMLRLEGLHFPGHRLLFAVERIQGFTGVTERGQHASTSHGRDQQREESASA
jgi:hypothetical protein